MIRTDMAVELVRGGLEGCASSVVRGLGGLTRTDIEIKSEKAARSLGKPRGNYCTVELANLYRQPPDTKEYAAKVIAKALADTLDGVLSKNRISVLVAGLGNKNMVADALGPFAVEKLIITRHFGGKRGKLGSLSAIAPGVLGVTGIETYDTVAGLVERTKPDAVIAIDTLASQKTERLASSFQITDTGITPGGGVGNHRFRLDYSTLGVPVIAIGVPLVVYASTISTDVLDEYFQRFPASANFAAAKKHTVKRVVSETLGELIVTPKDIDVIVRDCAHILALVINMAVHSLSLEDTLSYMQMN